MYEAPILQGHGSFINVYVTHHAKSDLMGIAKNIDPGQPGSKLFAIGTFSVH